MMNPKRLKQRMQKTERVITNSKQRNIFTTMDNYRTYNPTPPNNNHDQNQNYMSQLQTAIFQIASKLSSDKNNKMQAVFTKEMQLRDHYILLQAPKLPNEKIERQKQIKLWIGDVLHRVFSITFNYFSSKIFDTQTMKIYCSQCCIGNIIELSKHNELTIQDFKTINLHLKKSLLPYFLLRYPQSNNRQVNQKLNRQVSATDYLGTNQNNMFLNSKVRFQYRQNGIYFDQIMKFLNYLILLPNKELEQQNSKTVYDDFIQRMEKLFTAVYNRKWTQTNLYDDYIKKNLSTDTLRNDVKLLQSQVGRGSIRIKEKEKTDLDKDYEQLVKQYTKYAINRKVSQNVPLYSNQQINHGTIKILHPSILRIIVKWCIQLEEKFQSDYYIQKNEPFVMINGDEVQMIDELRQKLSELAADQWKQIQNFLLTIQNNIYQKQSELSFKNLMYYSSQKLSEYEQSIIKFANRNTEDVNHYAVCYLNRLIHGLMKLSKKMYDDQLKEWAEWPYPPTFISFTISDLIRCKCFSKQKQIIRIYKQLQIQSEINPKVIKIVKVKNRLNKGTKDILLNILFHQQILCQIQLAIKLDISDFSLYSDKFNHYIYELQRSTYGPITQMSSIWTSNDERSQFLKDQKIRIVQYDHKCQNIQYDTEIFPFTCNQCYKHFSQTRFIYEHFRCISCMKYWICGKCRITSMNQQQLIKDLMNKDNNLKLLKRIQTKNLEFPEYFVGFKLQSMKVISQKYRRIKIDKSIIIVKFQNGNLKVTQFKKNDQKQRKKLLQNFIYFEQKDPDPELKKLTLQQILDETSLVQIKQCYGKKSQSLRITRKNITKELLLKIKDSRAQACVTSLSFPENSIQTIKQIAEAFPNVKILNLNKNKLKSLQGISKMKCLTDVYLGENQFKQIVELDNLVNLKYIQLGDNINSPTFKCSLAKLTRLESVTLIRSNLTQFPQQLCNLPNLKLLWLFQNKIKRIPSSIGKLTNLEYLHMDMNQLRQLPNQIYTLQKLKKLMLSFNQIQQISDQISNLKNLQIISLENNPLKKVPQQKISSLKQLQFMTLNKDLQNTFMGKLIQNVVFK